MRARVIVGPYASYKGGKKTKLCQVAGVGKQNDRDDYKRGEENGKCKHYPVYRYAAKLYDPGDQVAGSVFRDKRVTVPREYLLGVVSVKSRIRRPDGEWFAI